MDQPRYMHSGDDEEPSVLIGRALLKLQNAVVTVMTSIRMRVIQSFVVSSVVFLLLWIAAFLYGSFYFTYMPTAAFSTPVHFYYRCVCEVQSSCIWTQAVVKCDSLAQSFSFFFCRTDCESLASFWCSYPVANISLMKNKKHVCICS